MTDDITDKASDPAVDPAVDGVGPVPDGECEDLGLAEEMGDDIGEPNVRPEKWEASEDA